MATILVVEDEAATRKPLARLLQQEGYSVLTARDAYSAAGAIRNNSPDLVLLDVGIPPMDGLTMMMMLRDEPKSRDVPVIVVTGHSDETTIRRAKEAGAKCCLIKSKFTPDELLAEIRKYLPPDGRDRYDMKTAQPPPP
jgi:CheY-like chemotaxis protein